MKYKTYIGPRLISPVLVLTAILTLLITGSQLYLSFQQESGRIHDSLLSIQKASALSIAKALQKHDDNQLTFILKTISLLPEVQYVELVNTQNQLFAYGHPWVNNPVELRRNVTSGAESRLLGHLRIISSKATAYQNLWKSGLWLLVANLCKILVLLIFMSWIVHQIITRRINQLKNAITAFSLHTSQNDNSLNNHDAAIDISGQENDEVTALGNSLNRLFLKTREQFSLQSHHKQTTTLYNQLTQLQRDILKQASENALFDKVIQEAINNVCEIFSWPVGHVYKVCPITKSRLWSTKIWCIQEPRLQPLQRHIDQSPLNEGSSNLPSTVISRGEYALCHVSRFPAQLTQTCLSMELNYWLAFPVKSGRETVAVIEFFLTDDKILTPRVYDELTHLCNAIGQIAERRRIQNSHVQALQEIRCLKIKLQKENLYLQREVKLNKHFYQIVGESEAMKAILSKADRVSSTETIVFISGETGTGKEFLAQAIHESSTRNDRALVKLNCSTLTGLEIERDLFGCELGHLPESPEFRTGLLELGENSTLLINQIEELPYSVQTKLVEALKDREFRRMGSEYSIRLACRLIATSSVDLNLAMKLGRFRQDLYYMITSFHLEIPPLRKRQEDIRPLVKYYCDHYAHQLNKTIFDIPLDTLYQLEGYHWPGNIRELKNVIERAVILSPSKTLLVTDLAQHGAKTSAFADETLEEVQKRHILTVVEQCNGQLASAAQTLQISMSELHKRLKDYERKEILAVARAT